MRPEIGMTVRVKDKLSYIEEGLIGVIEDIHIDPNPHYSYADVRFADVRFAPEIRTTTFSIYLRYLQYKKESI